MLGLHFKMENRFGKQLSDILVDIVDPSWYWSIGPGEVLSVEIPYPNFLPSNAILEGKVLWNDISIDDYYVIFADLKAFPTSEDVVEVKNYEDFLKSSCQLALLVIDSEYVSIILKEQQMVHKFSERAEALGYTNIKFLTDENKESLFFNVWG
ncbi:DUF2691 family protein [Psychrobacillus sp.]|uniref:DUF2691 family protein n=1 Tax=Psychrobacillus sp. TaxID=1871623 RepID=UPI0028BD5551|nr:DUF2691 family protein [Psychrobacillus sp.]